MFAQVVKALLAGEFVCAVAQPEGYVYLNEVVHRDQVNDYLAKLELQLAKTRHGGAYFAAYQQVGGPERRAAREVFTEVKHSLRPVVGFLDMVMRAMEQEQLLTIGSTVEVNKLMAAVDANPGFRNDLQNLAMQLRVPADGTDRYRLDKVLRNLKDKGYLVLVNSEREIYRVTGKIEFIQQVIEFLMENQGVSLEEDELPLTQENLL